MRTFTLFLLFLASSVCWAEDIPLTSTFTLQKPNIEKTKYKLSEEEQSQVENALKHQGRKLIHKELKPVKNDYENDYDRGTVEYTSKCRNYSFHKVIIPDGTTIYNTNFTQKKPYTNAIEGKNLNFIDCNMTNVLCDESWTPKQSTQIKRIKKSEIDLGEGRKKIIVSHQVLEDKPDGKFVEIATDEEISGDIDSYNSIINRLNK